MIVLLGGPDDEHLAWLAAALAERHETVQVVTPEEILTDGVLKLRLDRRNTLSSLTLRNGTVIDQDLTGLVVNRLTAVPHLRPPASTADDLYILEEWRAALTAWLRTLRCPVFNPPRAASLPGPDLPTAAWYALARAHGLRTGTWTSTQDPLALDPVLLICVGGVCIDVGGAAPPEIRDRLCRMARFAGAPLLGARLDRARDWTFVDTTVLPPLALGGQPLVDALIDSASSRRNA